MRFIFRLTAVLSLALLIGCQGGNAPVAPPSSQTISASFTHISQSDYATGQTVFFDASGSTDQLFKIVKYIWDWGDGSGTAMSDNPGASHVFNDPKTYTVKLTIVDQADREASSTQSVRIYLPGSAPVALFTYEAPDGWQPGSVMEFDASSSSDVDDDIVSYEWDWGDGMSPESVSPSTVSHEFSSEGLKKVVLTVTDGTGRQAISDPTEISIGYPDDPQLLGAISVYNSFTAWEPMFAAKVDGHYGYAALGESGFQVFDLQGSAAPKLVGQATTSDHCSDIALADGYAYVADFEMGLLVLDISNPLKPSLVSSLGNQGAMAVAVSPGYAYVVGSDFGEYPDAGGIININDPENPFICASIHWAKGYGTCVAVSPGYTVAGLGEYYSPNGIEIRNIYDSCAQSQAGWLEMERTPIDVEIARGILYVVLDEYYPAPARIETYDISNPDMPIKIGSIDMDRARDMQVLGDYAYCASNDGLVILDVSDPKNPFVFKSLEIPRRPWRIGVYENRALVLSFSPASHWMNLTNVLLW